MPAIHEKQIGFCGHASPSSHVATEGLCNWMEADRLRLESPDQAIRLPSAG